MIVLLGESASGKSTIEKKLLKKGYSKIISYTTRSIRPDEIDGKDYYFISDNDFDMKDKKNLFVEKSEYDGQQYGITKGDCLDDRIVVVNPDGFRQLKNNKELNIISFYIYVDEEKRRNRMVERGDNQIFIDRRIISDREAFQYVREEVDYIIYNDILDNAVKEITNTLEMLADK